MGEWLFKEDNFTPGEDRDKFIDKSIFSLLKLISEIKRKESLPAKQGIYLVSPLVKVVFTLILIVLIAVSRSFTYIVLLDVFILLSLLLLIRKDSRKVLAAGLIIPLFTCIILLPSMLMGNLTNSLMIILKTFTTITLVSLLSNTTSLTGITKALKALFVPDMFILVFETTIRYIYILGEASMEMFYALKLRSIGINNKKYNSISIIMGNLFLKSKEMGEEMYYAMECRGFTGEYSFRMKPGFRGKDMAYAALSFLLIAAYFIF